MKYHLYLLNILFILSLSFNATFAQCPAPDNISIQNITSRSAIFSFNPVASSTGYEYTISTTTTIPPNGVKTQHTNVLLQNLSPDTRYCIFVRTRCADGSYSSWTENCFYTSCETISNSLLSLSVLSGTQFSAEWPHFGKTGIYEYGITTGNVPPTNGGSTTHNKVLGSNLTPGVEYCFHLRAICESTGSFTDWVTKCITMPVANSISSSGDKNSYSIYPNPVKDILYISLPTISEKHSITIKSITGQTVYQKEVSANEIVINTNDIAVGVYILHISGNRYNAAEKLIINR